jgi:hypothetical protein
MRSLPWPRPAQRGIETERARTVILRVLENHLRHDALLDDLVTLVARWRTDDLAEGRNGGAI